MQWDHGKCHQYKACHVELLSLSFKKKKPSKSPPLNLSWFKLPPPLQGFTKPIFNVPSAKPIHYRYLRQAASLSYGGTGLTTCVLTPVLTSNFLSQQCQTNLINVKLVTLLVPSFENYFKREQSHHVAMDTDAPSPWGLSLITFFYSVLHIFFELCTSWNKQHRIVCCT